MHKITKKELFEILSKRHNCNPYIKLANLPSPDLFKDINLATKRIKEAILKKENITIIGDYDVDGVISTAIMINFFQQVNIDVKHIIPNRFNHGYGLSKKIVELINDGLVITVDNGISAYDASLELKEKNIDLIITDHHSIGSKIPIALAIINPKQKDCNFPFKDICGAQVAWYLCAAIKKEMNYKINMIDFFDYLSIAIIADMMPMTSLNYTMVKKGLEKLRFSNRKAFKALNNTLYNKSLVSDDIGFFIAPKLNSAGRIDSASIALDFLLSENDLIANSKLELLNDLNNQRKILQENIFQDASLKIKKNKNSIIVWDKNWHEGVIGIVASKLLNKYEKPAFVFSLNEKTNILKGSARANSNINLHKIISKASHLLIGFGGHKNAAGLSMQLNNIEAFETIIDNELSNFKDDLHTKQKPLGELDISSVDLEFLKILEDFEPYGLENEKPIFLISKASLIKEEYIGKERNHIKFTLSSKDGIIFEAIKFNDTKKYNQKNLNLSVSIIKNEFKGITAPQFLVQDIL